MVDYHNFPQDPTVLAFDPIQHLIAIGTRNGQLRILGRPGADNCTLQHPSDYAVVQIIFVINEGSLITVTADDTIHLWTYRLKKPEKPEIVHSLKFQRERITFCHLPCQSKWLFVGTERGNVHVVNVESFLLSGYVINWNKAIELSQRTHPGSIIHLSDCPIDPNKLLIGYDSGTMVFWNLKNKSADYRAHYPESLKSISWHHEGRQFICSHSDGSLTTWTIRGSTPVSVIYPHAKDIDEDLKVEACRPIFKIEWKTVRNSDSYIIFSGGLPYSDRSCSQTIQLQASTESSSSQSPPASPTPRLGPDTPQTPQTPQTPTAPLTPPPLANPTPPPRQQLSTASQIVTVIHGKSTTVLEMDHIIIDFVTLCESPWAHDFNEPYAIVVLLQNDLVFIDLASPGFARTFCSSTSHDGLNPELSSKLSNFLMTHSCCDDVLSDQMESLFIDKEMPEAPRYGFIKGLFGGGQSSLDREELFGETNAGRASKATARHIPGNLDQAKTQTGSLSAEMSKVREGLTERGEKLNQIEDRTVRMMSEAETFSSQAHNLVQKYRNKKWYHF